VDARTTTQKLQNNHLDLGPPLPPGIKPWGHLPASFMPWARVQLRKSYKKQLQFGATATDRDQTVGSPPCQLHAVGARATTQKLQKTSIWGHRYRQGSDRGVTSLPASCRGRACNYTQVAKILQFGATATDGDHTLGSPPCQLHAVDARATTQKLQKIPLLGRDWASSTAPRRHTQYGPKGFRRFVLKSVMSGIFGRGMVIPNNSRPISKPMVPVIAASLPSAHGHTFTVKVICP